MAGQCPGAAPRLLPGSAGNIALAEILLGKTNPSGKLPFTWEKQWQDNAAWGNYPDHDHPRSNTYKEGLFLGYRWFDAKNIEPLFPFGFGLSYTRFALSNLTAAKDTTGDISVPVTVQNTGDRAGAEVVQYLCSTRHRSAPPAARVEGIRQSPPSTRPNQDPLPADQSRRSGDVGSHDKTVAAAQRGIPASSRRQFTQPAFELPVEVVTAPRVHRGELAQKIHDSPLRRRGRGEIQAGVAL